jgi:hypothetical protein
MRKSRTYWTANFVRGIVALIVGGAILFFPDMTQSDLLLPIAVVASILGLALYVAIDSAIILFTSYTIPWRLSKLGLRIQGFTGIAIGLVLLSAIYSNVQLQWFLYLASAQILATAIAEFVVARHAASHAISIWNYAAATVALTCGISFWFIAMKYGAFLTPHEITEIIFGYLITFGIVQCGNSMRMLYALNSARDVAQEPNAGTA